MQYFTTEEVSKALQITEKTVRDFLKNGALRGYKIGGVWRISEDDFNDFMETRANKPKRSKGEDK